MYRRTKRMAFTLIELLTVMAIITLLIGILTPSLTTARDQAKKTAVRAQLNAMEVGLEAFRGDEGEYVPSNPVFFTTDPHDDYALLGPQMNAWEVGSPTDVRLQGAHLLLDALVGRDFLGYDPKAPPFGPGGQSATTYDRWLSTNDRRLPYVPPDGVDVTSEDKPPTDAFGGNPTLGEVHPKIKGDGADTVLCRVFRDKFGWPILYYRASPTANANTPIIATVVDNFYGDGVYDGLDNEYFTSYTTAAPEHKIEDAEDVLALPYADLPYLENRFAEFIRSLRSSTYDNTTPTNIDWPRPVKFGRYILLSPGKDGIYGNLDDVANFSVFSEER